MFFGEKKIFHFPLISQRERKIKDGLNWCEWSWSLFCSYAPTQMKQEETEWSRRSWYIIGTNDDVLCFVIVTNSRYYFLGFSSMSALLYLFQFVPYCDKLVTSFFLLLLCYITIVQIIDRNRIEEALVFRKNDCLLSLRSVLEFLGHNMSLCLSFHAWMPW